MKKTRKRSLLEDNLLSVMKALDNQVARAMQRTPQERSQQGVQKWQPYQIRIENLTALMLNAMGEETIQLDSLLICSQAMAKALQILIHDLGEQGLGKVRMGYCIAAMENIASDAERSLKTLHADECTLT